MSKLVIGYQNLIPSGSVSANGQDASFPIANVQADDPALAWHSSGTTAYMQVDWTADPVTPVELVVALGTNGTDAMTRRVRTDNDSAMGSPSHDSTSQAAFDVTRDNPLDFSGPFGRDVVYLPGEDIGNRYSRMDLVDAGNPDGYIRVGLWWAGPTWAPASGRAFTWRDETEYTAEGKARRRFALSWRHLPRAQGAALKSILHKLAGMGRVYLVLQDEETSQWHLEAMLCTISQVQETPVEDYVQISCVALEADW